jgi:hypothetical protein
VTRKNGLAGALLLLASVAFAQQSGVGSLGRPEWEYLVISYGKTYFAEPQKSSSYGPVTYQAGQEAVALQRSLDGLGRLGWELVAAIGVIGGDQELILKRRNDPALSKKETAFLAKQSQVAVAEIITRYKKEGEAAAKSAKLTADKKMLVDLDSVEREQEGLEREEAVKAYITELTESIAAAELVKKDRSVVGLTQVVTAQFDLTDDYLQNVNEYRKSSVDGYLTDRTTEINVNPDLLWIYDLELILEAYLKFNGKLEKVATKTVKYGLSAQLPSNE